MNLAGGNGAIFKRYFHFVIALILALQTVGFSLSTLIAPAFGATRTVICTGNGMLTILLDKDGTPLKTEQTNAPECAFSISQIALPEPAPISPVAIAQSHLLFASTEQTLGTKRPNYKRHNPRAPPMA